jgi:hypothetical protein
LQLAAFYLKYENIVNEIRWNRETIRAAELLQRLKQEYGLEVVA